MGLKLAVGFVMCVDKGRGAAICGDVALFGTRVHGREGGSLPSSESSQSQWIFNQLDVLSFLAVVNTSLIRETCVVGKSSGDARRRRSHKLAPRGVNVRSGAGQCARLRSTRFNTRCVVRPLFLLRNFKARKCLFDFFFSQRNDTGPENCARNWCMFCFSEV